MRNNLILIIEYTYHHLILIFEYTYHQISASYDLSTPKLIGIPLTPFTFNCVVQTLGNKVYKRLGIEMAIGGYIEFDDINDHES